MPAEIPKGYVFIARDILGSTLWEMKPEDRVAAITAIVISSYEPKKVWDGSRNIRIERGQFMRGREGFARDCKLTVEQTRNSVRRLECLEFLARRSIGRRYSVYTVPKYAFYQDRDRYGREKDLPEGAVLVARKILESPLWKMPSQDRAVAIACLLVAYHAEGTWTDGDLQARLVRGQLPAVVDRLAEASKLSVEDTQESLARLLTAEFLVKVGGEGVAIFGIPKYDFYQDASRYAEPGKACKIPHETRGNAGGAAGSAQGWPNGGPTVAQDPPKGGPTVAQRWPIYKNSKEQFKKGEEGGRTGPPSPSLFDMDALRGEQKQLLSPEDQIVEAYHARFPGCMAKEKVPKHVVRFLKKGGNWEEALRAVSEQEDEAPIWQILDAVLLRKTAWSLDDLDLGGSKESLKRDAEIKG